MNTESLRRKILGLAIQGKLVPQRAEDESAATLLQKICTVKKQMHREARLKSKDVRNDTVIYVGEDNLHYEKHDLWSAVYQVIISSTSACCSLAVRLR